MTPDLSERADMIHSRLRDLHLATMSLAGIRREHADGITPAAGLLMDVTRRLTWPTIQIQEAVAELRAKGYLFYVPEAPEGRGWFEQALYFDAQGTAGVRRIAKPASPPPRPSWDETGLALARVFADRSADSKIRVGCVILSSESKTLISGGLNGRYPGCPVETRRSDRQGESEMLHAEQQAIARARWEPGEKATLYTTVEPCHECALLILAARHINRVVYAQPYEGDGKRRRGSDILREAGVEVVEWKS